jgi:hypothetical protein
MIRCVVKEKGRREQKSAKKKLRKKDSQGMFELLRSHLIWVKRTYAGMYRAV